MEFTVKSVATICNSRVDPIDDGWAAIPSEIRFNADLPAECLDGIEEFSHVEVVYLFHKSVGSNPVLGAEHPRENTAWPKVGIYAQRKKSRPNFVGCTIVKLVRREGRSLFVERLDAIDGTPVLDIKPVMREFLPEGEVKQPAWSEELMRNYW
jgi:tRNA-Thr(GGU) m(6)t(6)A37 methyltransferase TsaA